jgi:hypothetical protein
MVMKTYIWNTEYDVFIAVAETEWDARDSILTQMGLDMEKYVNEPNFWDKEPPTEEVKKARASGRMRQISGEWTTTLNKAPDYILEGKIALIYSHGNE